MTVYKPPMHGRDHVPTGSDPIPRGAGGIHVLSAKVLNFSLGTSATAIDWVEDWSYTDGTTITVNGGGDLQIESAGVYLITWYSFGWTLTNAVASWVEWEVNVTSGSIGQWNTKPGAHEAYAIVPLRIDDAAVAFDITFGHSPDFSTVAIWDSGHTFPAVIQTRAFKAENATGVADTPDLILTVTRLGVPFE